MLEIGKMVSFGAPRCTNRAGNNSNIINSNCPNNNAIITIS